MTKSRRLLFGTGQSTPSIGTGEGKGDEWLRHSERTLETLRQFVKFVKKQMRSDWNE